MKHTLQCTNCKIKMEINTCNKETHAMFLYLYGRVSKITGARVEMKCPLCPGVLEIN
jgi:hypothetical protein